MGSSCNGRDERAGGQAGGPGVFRWEGCTVVPVSGQVPTSLEKGSRRRAAGGILGVDDFLKIIPGDSYDYESDLGPLTYSEIII